MRYAVTTDSSTTLEFKAWTSVLRHQCPTQRISYVHLSVSSFCKIHSTQHTISDATSRISSRKFNCKRKISETIKSCSITFVFVCVFVFPLTQHRTPAALQKKKLVQPSNPVEPLSNTFSVSSTQGCQRIIPCQLCNRGPFLILCFLHF